MEYHFAIPKSLQSTYSQDNNRNMNLKKMHSENNYKKSNLETNTNTGREVFFLSNKTVQPEEWESILKYISQSPLINTLHFSGLSIDSAGLSSVCEAILNNRNLKTLTLEWNFLELFVDEFESLCEGISRSNIQYINFNNNKLNSLHASAILRILKSKTVVSINLKWNDFGNDTIKQLIEHIKSNSNLQSIDLSGNKVSHELLSELDETLQKNKQSKYNYFFSGQDTQGGPELLSSSMHRNRKQKSQTDVNYQSSGSHWPLYHNKSDERYTKTNYAVSSGQTTNDPVEEEYKARYDKELVSSLNLDRKIAELELELKTNKTKYIELKDKTENMIQEERNQYSILEQEYNLIKESLIKKEFELVQMSNDYETRISELSLQNEQLMIENFNLKEKFDIQVSLNEEKAKDTRESLKDNLDMMSRAIEELTKENERLRLEMNDDMKILTKEFEKRIKSQDENTKKLSKDKENLFKELNNLKKEYSDLRSSKDFEIKQRETTILEEESRKLESVVKGFESKFMTLSNLLKEANTKLGYVNDENSKLKREILDESSKLESKIYALQSEKESVSSEISQLTKAHQILKSQTELKDELIKVSLTYNFR